VNAANPYEAPKSRVEDSAERRYYSAWQICAAALLGGPLAAGYLAARDHRLFGSPTKAKRTLMVAVAVLAGLLVLGYVTPQNSSMTIPAAVMAAIYRQYATTVFGQSIAQRKEQGWVQDSWWRVVGISLGFLVLTLAIVVLSVLLFPPRGA
jgi:hypothetical protein